MKVLVVDDSALMRRSLTEALRGLSNVTVLEGLSNGRLAMSYPRLGEADLIVVDHEMPVLDGLGFIKEYRAKGGKARILMFSAHSEKGAKITIEALLCGADDFLAKSAIEKGGDPIVALREALKQKIAQFDPEQRKIVQIPVSVPRSSPQVRNPRSLGLSRVLIIGSSTGGPEALRKFFSVLEPPGVPVLVVQHMPALFTAELAKLLQKVTPMKVKEGEQNEELAPNTVYIAPGDFHMSLKKLENKTVIVLDQGEKVNFVRPAFDRLLDSLPATYGGQSTIVTLTGMGDDGTRGIRGIRDLKPYVIIQDEKSSVVWGMPGAVFKANLFDEMLDLMEIPKSINKSFKGAA